MDAPVCGLWGYAQRDAFKTPLGSPANHPLFRH